MESKEPQIFTMTNVYVYVCMCVSKTQKPTFNKPKKINQNILNLKNNQLYQKI